MFLAKVTGSIVATQKVDNMRGQKLLIVEPFRLDPETHKKLITTGRSFVTVDTLGAGVGEMVLISQGSSARFTPETKELPIDTVIIGIVDRVDALGAPVFETGKD
jgi:ethanolamine utilization protein EutN